MIHLHIKNYLVMIKLNVKVNAGGNIRVGLLDENDNPIPGRAIADCVPITADNVNLLVNWTTGTDVSARAGIPTKMRIEMTNTSLFAFGFE